MSLVEEKISLFFKDKHHLLGELSVDAVIRESHEFKAKVGEHPSESGQNFCDHVALSPTTLQIEGVISNTPMTLLGLTAVRSFDNFIHKRSNDLVDQAFKKLEDIFTQREPITITTSLKDYENMVLESLSIERNAQMSSSMHFKATAKQIRLINQVVIALPKPKKEQAKPKERLGKQITKPASEEIKEVVKKRSLLGAVTGWGT